MRQYEAPNPGLMAFFESDILPKIPEKLRELDSTLNENNFPSRKYILYGSFSRGTPSTRSDVDIGVVVDSTKGVKLRDFYDYLGDKGTLCRIRGARIELTLIEKDDVKSPDFKDQQPISLEADEEDIKT